MDNKIMTKIRDLKVQIDEKENVRIGLRKQVQDLLLDEKVRKYASLINEIEDFDEDIDILNSQIVKLEKHECMYDSHSVLFCLGIDRDDYEGRSYYACKCLNCGDKVVLRKGNMELSRIIDGRNYIKNNGIVVHEILENANKEYRLLRECYYKYPGVLDQEKLNTTIYKVMRKRYEANN